MTTPHDSDPSARHQESGFSNAEAIQAAFEAAQEPEASAPEAARSTPELHYVLCAHTPENVPKIMAELGDCNVLAIEFIQHNKKKMARREQALADYLSSNATDKARSKAENIIRDDDEFNAAILDHLPDGVKRVQFIDARPDDKRIQVLLDLQDEAEEKLDSEKAKLAPSAALKSILLTQILLSAKVDREREALVTSQIKQLAAELTGEDKIGIIMGSTHTGPFHDLYREGYQVERSFVSNMPTNSGEKIRYPYQNEAIRGLKYVNPSEIDPHLLNRILLDHFYDSPKVKNALVEPSENPSTRSKELKRIKYNLIDNMTDEEVAELIAETDRIKARNEPDAQIQIDTALLANALLHKPSS